MYKLMFGVSRRRCAGVKKIFFAVHFFLAALLFVLANPSDYLPRQIDLILNQPALKRVLISACVLRSGTGEVVYERNPHLALLPASNMKIVTSAAALERLGPDFTFVTRVGTCGDSLVVIGSGDPLLGLNGKTPELGRNHQNQNVIKDIVTRLKERDVKSISDIILDTSVFDSQRTHPSWPREQLVQKYACEVGGLNYLGNCVGVSIVNEKGKVLLVLDPPTGYLSVINAVTPVFGRENWFSVERTGERGRLLVRGKCANRAGPYSVAVEDPALFFGQLLFEALTREGVRVGGRILEQPLTESCEFQPVVEFKTSLIDCLQRMNKDSLGLAAEAVFKTLGAQPQPTGKGGSWETGSRVVSEYLRSLGIGDGEFTIADGCGLSRENRLSASAIAKVFLHLSSGPNWETYENTLAVGGIDGTIENHFWERKYRGKVQAKTGYIQGVRALSGAVHTDKGDFIFSFLANRAGGGARTAIEACVKAIIASNAKPGK